MESSVTLTQDELLFLWTKNSVGLTYSLLEVSQYKIIMPQTNQHLTRLLYVQSSRSNFKSFINLLWSCSRVFLEKRTSWSGYMSIKAAAQTLEKSVATMLPVINLSATNMAALHSLLCFVVKLPTPSSRFTNHYM